MGRARRGRRRKNVEEYGKTRRMNKLLEEENKLIKTEGTDDLEGREGDRERREEEEDPGEIEEEPVEEEGRISPLIKRKPKMKKTRKLQKQWLSGVITAATSQLNNTHIEVPRSKTTPSSHYCLFCFKKLRNPCKLQPNLEGHFNTMFILKKMLSVPSDKLVEYLQQSGNPTDWITFCRKCAPVVHEAVQLQKGISELEEQLKKCQEKMTGKIRETWGAAEEAMNLSSPTSGTRKLVASKTPREGHRPLMMGSPPSLDDLPPGASDDSNSGGGEVSPPKKSKRTPRPYSRREKVKDSSSGATVGFQTERYSCHLCPRVKSMDINRLIRHIIFHYNRPLKCGQCGFHYSTPSDLQSRPFLQQNGDPHQCSVTDLLPISYSPVNLLLWQCGLCPLRFDTEQDRDRHESSSHPPPDETSVIAAMRYRGECRVCSKSCRNMAEWRLHRVLEHPEVAAISCFYCDRTFQSKSAEGLEFLDEEELLSHVNKDHKWLPSSGVEPSLKNRWLEECLLCGDWFQGSQGSEGLNLHMEAVHGVSKHDSYSCPVCPIRKSRWSLLQRHVRIVHKGDKPPVWKCSKDGCSFECGDKRKLKKHLIKEHGTKRSNKCQFCGNGFSNAKKKRAAISLPSIGTGNPEENWVAISGVRATVSSELNGNVPLPATPANYIFNSSELQQSLSFS